MHAIILLTFETEIFTQTSPSPLTNPQNLAPTRECAQERTPGPGCFVTSDVPGRILDDLTQVCMYQIRPAFVWITAHSWYRDTICHYHLPLLCPGELASTPVGVSGISLPGAFCSVVKLRHNNSH